MPFKVRVEVGRGKNRSVSESVSLPNKKRVFSHIKKHPFVKSNTQIKVTNLRTNKVTTGTQGRFLPSRKF